MTKEQLAELLNGNEYRDEMTKEQEQAEMMRWHWTANCMPTARKKTPTTRP